MSSRSSSPDSASSLPPFVTVGLVGKPHGVRGEVFVKVFSDVGDRFDVGADLRAVKSGHLRQTLSVVTKRQVKGGAILRFEGFDTRDQVEGLRGSLLEVARGNVPPAPAGSYYFFELIGCECFDARAGRLGRVRDVLDDGGGLLLAIESGERNELLVPFVSMYLGEVDVEGRRIDLQLPDGLIELCGSRS